MIAYATVDFTERCENHRRYAEARRERGDTSENGDTAHVPLLAHLLLRATPASKRIVSPPLHTMPVVLPSSSALPQPNHLYCTAVLACDSPGPVAVGGQEAKWVHRVMQGTRALLFSEHTIGHGRDTERDGEVVCVCVCV